MSALSSQSHSQEAILEQKRLRVDRSIEATEAKVASLHGDIRNLHRDMTRLNDMISKNAALQEGLANENYALETEFVNELKEMEEESVRLDNQVKTLKEKKAELLKDIVEAEGSCCFGRKNPAREGGPGSS